MHHAVLVQMVQGATQVEREHDSLRHTQSTATVE
jgi:hypothetical protein